MNSSSWKQGNYASNNFRSTELLCKHLAAESLQNFQAEQRGWACKTIHWATEMAYPSWCGPGHGFTDETGMPWHSVSSVLGARCWPDASAKLLALCSSWGMGPSSREQPHAAALSLTPCKAVHCHMSWHVGDSPVSRGGTAATHLHNPCSCWGCCVCACGLGGGKWACASSTLSCPDCWNWAGCLSCAAVCLPCKWENYKMLP